MSKASPDLVRIQREHFHAAEVGKYYNVQSGLVQSEKAFSSTHAHRTIKFTDKDGKEVSRSIGHRTFITDGRSPKVQVIGYHPDQATRIFTTERGVVTGNIHVDDGVSAEPGDCSLWDAHMAWLIPNAEDERDELLDVIAHSLQYPGRETRRATLIITEDQRTGKSTVSKAWGAMLGKSNWLPVNNEEISSAFSGGIYNRQLVVFEELFIRGGDIYNTLKDLISEDDKRSQTKGVDFMTQASPLNILALSNKEVPVMISEPQDGRWHVIRSTVTRRPDAYYQRLYTEGWAQLGAWKAALLRRDLSGFNPDAAPTMTKAKQAIIERSASPLDKALSIELERDDRLVIVPTQLLLPIRRQGVRVSLTELHDALRSRGAKKLRQMWVTLGQHGQRESVWALTDVDHWTEQSDEALRAALHRHVGG